MRLIKKNLHNYAIINMEPRKNKNNISDNSPQIVDLINLCLIFFKINTRSVFVNEHNIDKYIRYFSSKLNSHHLELLIIRSK